LQAFPSSGLKVRRRAEELAKDELNVKEIRYDAKQADEVIIDENLTRN